MAITAKTGTRILGWIVACIILGACATSGSEEAAQPLRGFDGEVVNEDGTSENTSSTTPSSLPLATDEPDDAETIEQVASSAVPTTLAVEELGWLNPDLIHGATAIGTRMVNFRRLSPYEITFYGNLPACEAVDTYLNAELSATVDAAMYRGTTGATLGGLGEDGTLLFAGAISYSDTVEVADVADAYNRGLQECVAPGVTTTVTPLTLDDGTILDVLTTDSENLVEQRAVVQHRSNLMVVVLGWVNDDGDHLFEEFVQSAHDQLWAAVPEEEILPTDLQ